MNNFGQMDPNMLSLFLNPETAPGGMAAPGIGGLGQVSGMGQIMPKQEGPAAPIDKFSAAGGFGMGAGATASAGATGGGGGEMASILGMEAIKGMQAAGQGGGGGGLSSQAPVAPRGNQVKTETEDKANPIDPRIYLMMQSMMGGGR